MLKQIVAGIQAATVPGMTRHYHGAMMSDGNESRNLMVVVGVAGVFVLLATSLAVALWESSTRYQQDQINRIVAEQDAAQIGESQL